MSNEKPKEKQCFEAPVCELLRISAGDVLTASDDPGLDGWSPYY